MGNLLVKDKKFYKSFFSLAAIVCAQSIIALGVNLADNVMLGRYSELAISGAALVNQIQFVLQMIVAGIANGIVVLASQYWGKRQIDPIRRVISVGMKLAMGCGALFLLVTGLFPRQCLLLLTADEQVIAEGIRYMRIMCWTYLIFTVSNTLVMSLRSVETAFIGTVISIATMFSNIILNYCLIYGHFGFPEMGIRGAATATLVSRILELVIILGYTLFVDKKLRLRLRDIFGFDFTYWKDYIRTALPLIGSGAIWGVAQAAQTSILGHMTQTAIAANSIASVVYQVIGIISVATASASNVVIGKTVGEGRLDMVRAYTRTLQIIFVGVGLVSAVLLMLFKDAAVALYNVSPETTALAKQFLIVLSITVIGSSYEYPAAGGIIAGGGDTRYTFILDTVFMWCLVIPGSALAAFVFHAPPLVTFCILKCDQILKCIPNGIYCNSFKWIRQLTR
ncbi:MAG: MATE family efflux transporter [Oscillospiraceae bacterium]|nr:MATE family efflux transporter [Oscillospiraceae bacterium]